MNASSPPIADPIAVRAFCEVIHNAAAVALEGANRPGMLQLVRIHPADEKAIPSQFKIGEIDLMARHAVMHAGAGYNVYVETRTVEETPRGERGGASATRGVFAFVVDADNDKGKGGHTGVQPSLAVETSPGNAHHWLFLSRALTADQAKPLGEAIRHKTGADSATGVVTQPYRVAGTPNYPGKLKLARGRVATPTRILDHHGKAWSADELQAEFPPKPKAETTRGPRPTGASGRTSNRVEDLVSETGIDRSERFHAAVATAFKDGLTLDDLEALMRQHPEGCGGKYLEPYDRLAREIERSWEKVEAKAEEVRQAASKPAYADGSSPVEDARQAVAEGVHRFIEAATAWRLAGDNDAIPPVHALPVSTGVGKTRVTARTVAEYIVERRGQKGANPILYAVPTHRLGNEIEAQFAEHGVFARVFRGRSADDPARPGEQMCDDLEAVNIALSMGAAVGKACCKTKLENGTEARCQFFSQCSYQAQMTAGPEVWIVAHQMLFQATAALGKVEMVIIDEGFWQTGIRIPKRGLTLDEIGAAVASSSSAQNYLANDVEVYRAQFARALKRQGQPGGVHRADLIAEGMTVDRCTAAISAEWNLKDKVAIWPGMPKADRRIAARAADKARHSQAFISLWNAARGLLYDEEVEVSGRLYIDTREDDDGRVLVAKARSLKTIKANWQKPTLILDATLPSLEILKAFYPEVEPAPAIEAAMPHVRVRQVIDSPTSGRKLKPDEDGGAGRNLRAIRREILRRFLALGRAPVLVIAQKAISEWLRTSGLPAGISTEHFNNVAGLDQYRAVRGLIVVGRTLPSPLAVEALAGAITGKDIEKADPWYPKPVKGLRTRDGSTAGMECETHPDPVADACRWQICEGELMQALGRARGVNRTTADPLDIDIIANVVLPMTVDVAEPWNPPGEEIEMLIEGVVLDSAADMAAAWPSVWATAGAARIWLHRHTGAEPNTVTEPYKTNIYKGFGNGVPCFRYQRAGAKQKWRTGAYDPAVIPDPREWLESRLGPLSGFHILETAAQPAGPARAADYAPELVARFRLVAETPAADFNPAPVKAEVVRWDLKMPGPGSVYARLVAALPPVEPKPTPPAPRRIVPAPRPPAGTKGTPVPNVPHVPLSAFGSIR